MIEQGVAEPSSSPWAAPIVLVRKHDGTIRFCTDYRALNAVTKKDVYPLPRVENCLDRLGGCSLFTVLDCMTGYWQISIRPEDREKTAFITPDGLNQYRRMPFGLANALQHFKG